MRACQCQCVVTADDEAQSEAGTHRGWGAHRGVAGARRQAEAERQRWRRNVYANAWAQTYVTCLMPRRVCKKEIACAYMCMCLCVCGGSSVQRAVTESGVVSTLRKEADSAHSASRQSKAVAAANSDLSAGKMAAPRIADDSCHL